MMKEIGSLENIEKIANNWIKKNTVHKKHNYTWFSLVVLLCFVLSSCQKGSNLSSQPLPMKTESKFLFTASESKIEIKQPKSSSYSLMYLDLITKEKKEIKNLTSISPHRTIISPDRKYFIMFFIKIDATGQKRYDLYTMKADGSDFQCVSERLGINDLAEYFYADTFPNTYYFSPDGKSILLMKKEFYKPTKIYMISLDGTFYKFFKNNDAIFPILSTFLEETVGISDDHYILHSSYVRYYQNLTNISWDSQQQVFLLAIKNTLGLFSWKTMTYTPFYEHSAEISSCSMSPDKKYILFNEGFEKTFQVEGNLQIEKYAVFDVYCYSTDTKAIQKIITQEPVSDLSWLNNGYQFFYMNTIINEPNLFEAHSLGRVLFLYDLHAMKSEKILDGCNIRTIDFFSSDLYITGSLGIDNAFPSVLNLSKKTIEDLHGIDDLDGYSYEDRIQNNLLYIFYTNGFFSINPVNMQVQKKTFFKYEGDFFNDEEVELAFSPDDKIVCYKHDSFLSAFDFQGLELFQYVVPKDHIIENIFFLNEHSIVYIERERSDDPLKSILNTSYNTDLYFYSNKTKQTTNLTNEDWGRIKCYRLSPDQRYVAVIREGYTKKYTVFSYSIDCFSLVVIGKKIPIMQISSTDSSFHQQTEDIAIQWSPDSQFLYYTGINSSTNEWTEENWEEEFFSFKCFSLKKNKIIENKAIERCIFFDFSPNGKKIVLLHKDKNKILLMDTKTGDRDDISSQIAQSEFLAPEWSQDGKKIVFSNKQNELFIIDSEGKMLFKKDLLEKKSSSSDYMYSFLFPDHFFSPNNQDGIYLKQYKYYTFYSQAVLLLNLNQEIILEGTILDYQWSPDGKELLLMENKENEENQYIVTHLKLYHTNDRTYTHLQFNLKKIMDACWSKDGDFVYAFGEDLETNQIILKRLNKNGEHLETVFVFGNAGTHFLDSFDGIEKIEKLEALK